MTLLALMALTGAVSLIAGLEPESVTNLAPRWISITWAAIFTAGAVLTFIGVSHPDPEAGLVYEFAGRAPLAGATLAYVVALIGVGAAIRGTVLVGILLGISVASVWRLWQILCLVRDTDHQLRDLAADQGNGDQ